MDNRLYGLRESAHGVELLIASKNRPISLIRLDAATIKDLQGKPLEALLATLGTKEVYVEVIQDDGYRRCCKAFQPEERSQPSQRMPTVAEQREKLRQACLEEGREGG